MAFKQYKSESLSPDVEVEVFDDRVLFRNPANAQQTEIGMELWDEIVKYITIVREGLEPVDMEDESNG